MKYAFFSLGIIGFLVSLLCFGCSSNASTHSSNTQKRFNEDSMYYRSFPSQIAWGKHLVNLGGCNDCHTPKIRTSQGIRPDPTMHLAGHSSKNSLSKEVDRNKVESRGWMLTNDETVWIAPWGVTFSSNLTPDETGLGDWTEAQFIRCIRDGKWMGDDSSRSLLPPMSFVAANLNHEASDDELKAIFAYLKSIQPVHNIVRGPIPPINAKE